MHQVTQPTPNPKLPIILSKNTPTQCHRFIQIKMLKITSSMNSSNKTYLAEKKKYIYIQMSMPTLAHAAKALHGGWVGGWVTDKTTDCMDTASHQFTTTVITSRISSPCSPIAAAPAPGRTICKSPSPSPTRRCRRPLGLFCFLDSLLLLQSLPGWLVAELGFGAKLGNRPAANLTRLYLHFFFFNHQVFVCLFVDRKARIRRAV